jgi:hypothetical protein
MADIETWIWIKIKYENKISKEEGKQEKFRIKSEGWGQEVAMREGFDLWDDT